jgi:MoaA/NifB/PqqE/SkfB family radical SAM enzyme
VSENKLQTNPYLTFIRPDDTGPPVVYPSTDTRRTSYPQFHTTSRDALFGVIELDRRTIWRSDESELIAAQYAAEHPVDESELIDRFGKSTVESLVELAWLQDPADLCKDYYLRTAQIEITAHCNWGCRFCPVSNDPKPRQTMPVELFTEIVEKLKVHETVNYVTFHFYNEPTLDKYFDERIDVLRRYEQKLSLSTNASGLVPHKVSVLAESNVLHHLIVNLPSLDVEEFKYMTNSATFVQCMRNIENAADARLPMTIVVNGKNPRKAENVAMLRKRFEPAGVEVVPTLTADRAGLVGDEFDQEIHIKGRLRGCAWPVNHGHFSVRGDMFICCNDYYQRVTFGNVENRSIHDVMTSKEAILTRRRVFGIDPAPDGYICRRCHDQLPDFERREFKPIASFPLIDITNGGASNG